MQSDQVNVDERDRPSSVSACLAVEGLCLISSAGLGQMAETMMGDPLYQGRPGYEGMLNQVSLLDLDD